MQIAFFTQKQVEKLDRFIAFLRNWTHFSLVTYCFQPPYLDICSTGSTQTIYIKMQTLIDSHNIEMNMFKI